VANGARGNRDRGRDRRSGAGSRANGMGLRRLLGWLAFLPVASRAPSYTRLIWELVRDERTPNTRKALLAGALGYLVLGRDLIPDNIPILGGLDDLVVVVLAVEVFLDGVPSELLHEKLVMLGIDRDAFERDMAQVRRLMPGPVRRAIRRVPGAIGAAANAVERSGIVPRVRSWIYREGSTA
jgi:uncharacterized membrane protein YkvA (DUF1232 family)